MGRFWILMAAWGCAFFLFMLVARGEGASQRALTRSLTAFEQAIPLVVVSPVDQKTVCLQARLGWKPWEAASDIPDESISFDFDPKIEPQAAGLLQSQLWISALAGALVWQEPWRTARWTVSDVPVVEIPALGAALAIGMIATAANIPFPQDTAVLGALYPDGAIGPVSQLVKRIDAASAAGMKRLVASNLQRLEFSQDGSSVNILEYAQSRGLKCLFVDDLAEAAEKVLGRDMPRRPEVHVLPHYDGRLFTGLDERCRKEMTLLQAASSLWPRQPAQLASLPPLWQELWKQVFRDYDAGVDARRAGLLYVAREKLNEANAGIQAIGAWSSRPGNPDYKTDSARATALRKKIAASMEQTPMDANELQSALVLAEEDNWLYRVNARVEGAQILAYQAFASRSNANLQQQESARNLLLTTVSEAEYQLKDLSFYPSLHDSIRHPHPVPAPGQATPWLALLTPTYLAAFRCLDQGLMGHAAEYGEALLFDARLATHARVLRDAQAAWQRQVDRKNRQQAKARPPVIWAGYIPGPAYASLAPPVSPLPLKSLSDTAQALIWANRYCEVAALELKYLGSGGVFEPFSRERKNQNRAFLQNMLQDAGLAARRGIAFAEKAGVDPAILALIYERASYLRGSADEEEQLEALQSYWRCSLLGNLCWQLGASRSVSVEPTVPAIPSPAVVTPAPLVPEPPKAAPPPSIPAISVTPEELNQVPQ